MGYTLFFSNERCYSIYEIESTVEESECVRRLSVNPDRIHAPVPFSSFERNPMTANPSVISEPFDEVFIIFNIRIRIMNHNLFSPTSLARMEKSISFNGSHRLNGKLSGRL